MGNNKGVTLVSLAIMIVLLLVLASIGANYSSNSINMARLTKFTAQFEIINAKISVLHDNKSYENTYTDYDLDATKDAELITKINNLLNQELIETFKISSASLTAHKSRFKYYSSEEIKDDLEIDGIEGTFLINIQDKIVISYEGIKYQEEMYYTLEELNSKNLVNSSYNVSFKNHENPNMPKGFYYVAGTWDTGYVISDSKADQYNSNQTRQITTEIADNNQGNLYMWIPIIEKDETNANGADWSGVLSETDYANIKTALDTFKTVYVAPEYAKDWYTAENAQYAYINLNSKLMEYPSTGATEDEKNALFQSIYTNGGLYVKIREGKEVEEEDIPQITYTYIEYIESTGTQYINTGYNLKTTSRIETSLSISAFDTTGRHGMFGSYMWKTTFYQLYASGTSNQYFATTFGYNGHKVLSEKITLNEKYIINLQNGSIKINNNVYELDEGTVNSTIPLYIFYRNTDGDPAGIPAKMKLYYFKIYEGDTLVRDFVPVLSSRGVACLYDKVEGKYYYNQGTETFLYN